MSLWSGGLDPFWSFTVLAISSRFHRLSVKKLRLLLIFVFTLHGGGRERDLGDVRRVLPRPQFLLFLLYVTGSWVLLVQTGAPVLRFFLPRRQLLDVNRKL